MKALPWWAWRDDVPLHIYNTSRDGVVPICNTCGDAVYTYGVHSPYMYITHTGMQAVMQGRCSHMKVPNTKHMQGRSTVVTWRDDVPVHIYNTSRNLVVSTCNPCRDAVYTYAYIVPTFRHAYNASRDADSSPYMYDVTHSGTKFICINVEILFVIIEWSRRQQCSKIGNCNRIINNVTAQRFGPFLRTFKHGFVKWILWTPMFVDRFWLNVTWSGALGTQIW